MAMPFSYKPGHGEKGVNWFGIYLGMLNLWFLSLDVKVDLCCYTAPAGREGNQLQSNAADARCHLVGRSMMSITKPRRILLYLISQFISWTFAPDDLHPSAGKKAMLLDA